MCRLTRGFGIHYRSQMQHSFASVLRRLGMTIDAALHEPEQSVSDKGANAESRWRLDRIVAALRASRDITHNIRHDGRPGGRQRVTRWRGF